MTGIDFINPHIFNNVPEDYKYPDITSLRYIKLHPNVPDIKKATDGSACFDIHYWYHGNPIQCLGKTNLSWNGPDNPDGLIEIPSHSRVLLPTGLIFLIPIGHSVRLHSRSGISFKKGLVLVNGEGVIDSDYTLETFISVTNISDNTIILNQGERIAQGELVKNEMYIMSEIPHPGEDFLKHISGQRTGGFGSTG